MQPPAKSYGARAPELWGMNNQTIILAGASSGIGLAAAQRLAAEGASVCITGRNPAKLTASGLPHAVVDSRDRAALDAFFAGRGAFDHLVVSLSSNKGLGPFSALDLSDLREGFEAKFWAALHTVQAALPYVRKSITLITAISATGRLPGTSGIGAINGALEIMVPIWARELAPVRINAVSPGVIDTPWWDFIPAADKAAAFEQYAAQIPLRRVGRASDVAEAIDFLIRAEYVTGRIVVVDGGLG